MQRQTFLKIFVPEDPPQFFFIRIFHKPTGLHRKVKSIMFLQRVILFYSHFAYETAIKGASAAKAAKNAINALAILSKKAGIMGMVGGQVVDVELTGKKLDEERLDFIFKLKTGALLEASLMVGAALAGADEKYIELMEQAGLNIGMAFQIQDDILDVTSTTEELGKPVHSDEKNDKTTYVSLYGLEKSHEDVEKYSKKALSIMEELPYENQFLYTLIEKLINRRK